MQLFREHYARMEKRAKTRLRSFRKQHSSHQLLEELIYCTFTANSSAKMGLKAVELLKRVMDQGTLEDYERAVRKKVRFYNKRAQYAFHNRLILEGMDLKKELDRRSHLARRSFLKETFKGFGMKESSHFLRNIGYTGYCIIDMHVLSLMHEFGITNLKKIRNERDYLLLEKRLQRFAKTKGYDIDVLDLALWSYRTGEIIK